MKQVDENRRGITDRLKELLKNEGIAASNLSEKIGLKSTSFSKTLNGTTPLTQTVANSIELKFGYRAEWLLTGEGVQKVDPKRVLSLEEQTLLEVVNPDHITEFFKRHLIGKQRRSVELRRFRIEEALRYSEIGVRREGHEVISDLLQRDEKRMEETLQHFEAQAERLENDCIEVLPNRIPFSPYKPEGITKKESHETQLSLYAKKAFLDTMAQFLFFGEQWEGLKERSQAYQSLQGFLSDKKFSSLKAHFEESMEKFSAMDMQLKRLFALNEEEEAILRSMEEEKIRSLHSLQHDDVSVLFHLEENSQG